MNKPDPHKVALELGVAGDVNSSPAPGPKVLTPEAIAQRVADHFKTELSAMQGRSRARKVVHVRRVAMYLIRTLTPASYPEIGRLFGRHHTSVMHSIGAVQDLPHDVRLEAYALLQALLKELNG